MRPRSTWKRQWETAGQLAARDATHRGWAEDLAISLIDLGHLYWNLSRRKDAGDCLERSKDLIEKMRSAGIDLKPYLRETTEALSGLLADFRHQPEVPAAGFMIDETGRRIGVYKDAIVRQDVAALEAMSLAAGAEARAGEPLSPWEIRISGYDDDPRGLFLIPEVRQWCRRACSAYGFIPLLVGLETFQWFAFCLVEIQSVTPAGQAGADPRDIFRLIEGARGSLVQFLAQREGVAPKEAQSAAEACRSRLLSWLM